MHEVLSLMCSGQWNKMTQAALFPTALRQLSFNFHKPFIPRQCPTFPAGPLASFFYFFFIFWLWSMYIFEPRHCPQRAPRQKQRAVDHRLGRRPTRHPRKISSLCGHCAGAGCEDTATLYFPQPPHWECKFNSFRFIFLSHSVSLLYWEGESGSGKGKRGRGGRWKQNIISNQTTSGMSDYSPPRGLEGRLMPINHNRASQLKHILLVNCS